MTSRRNCPAVVPANIPYSSDKAETMAKWSSVAYIKPAEKDRDSIQNIVASEIAAGYRVGSEFIFQHNYTLQKHV